MKIDPSIQAAGSRCGVDVEALYKKYARGGAPKRNSLDAAAAVPGEKTTSTEGLDRLRVCKACHGYGLVKTVYNHQVKEANCEECEGEGIVEEKAFSPRRGNPAQRHC